MIYLARNSSQSNESEEFDAKEKEKQSIFVKVDEDARAIIDKYKNMGIKIGNVIEDAIDIYNDFNSLSPEIKGIIEKYQEEDEPFVSFLERAIRYFGEQKDLDRDLWVRARDEMKMMLIGKTTFNQLIHAAEMPEDARDKPYKKNVAIDLILWYTKKPLKSLSIEDIICTIKKIWVVANYFHTIDVNPERNEETMETRFHILFKHRQNKRYSEYWLGYFTRLFNSEEIICQCKVEGQAFDETLSMTVIVPYEKEEK